MQVPQAALFVNRFGVIRGSAILLCDHLREIPVGKQGAGRKTQAECDEADQSAHGFILPRH